MSATPGTVARNLPPFETVIDAAPHMRFVQSDMGAPPTSSQKENIPEMKNIKAATEDAAGIVLRFIERIGGVSPELTSAIAEVRLPWSL